MSSNREPPVWPAGGMHPCGEDAGEPARRRSISEMTSDQLWAAIMVVIEARKLDKETGFALFVLYQSTPGATVTVISGKLEKSTKGAHLLKLLQANRALGDEVVERLHATVVNLSLRSCWEVVDVLVENQFFSPDEFAPIWALHRARTATLKEVQDTLRLSKAGGYALHFLEARQVIGKEVVDKLIAVP